MITITICFIQFKFRIDTRIQVTGSPKSWRRRLYDRPAKILLLVLVIPTSGLSSMSLINADVQKHSKHTTPHDD